MGEKIAIIGAGWYGCHLALALRKRGYDVTLFEKNSQIFSGVSGKYGIRLHAGLHYPRSDKTRENCRSGFAKFRECYPELVIEHEHAYYGVGTTDADGNPSKVTKEQFLTVAQELDGIFDWKEIDPEEQGFRELETAIDLDEPSAVLGEPLREAFMGYLKTAGVKVVCNFDVEKIEKDAAGNLMVHGNKSAEGFSKVINATGYQAHLPKKNDFPIEMNVTYQPCLSLVYEDTQTGNKPISFIVMDGWFPCIMPVCDREQTDMASREYILTHGKYTIMGNFQDPNNARTVLSRLNDAFVETNIKKPSESEMNRFWPEFSERFRYKGWRGEVLAKLKTKKEFRSGFTYENDDVIHVFPGKISNIFDVEAEVLSLLHRQNVISQNGYSFIQSGVIQDSRAEIQEKPLPDEPNTGNLQTFIDLIDEQTLAREKYLAQQASSKKVDPSCSLQLQCLSHVFEFAAMLGAAVLAYMRVRAIITLSILTAAVELVGYRAHNFFSSSNKNVKNTPVAQLSEDFAIVLPYDEENGEELTTDPNI